MAVRERERKVGDSQRPIDLIHYGATKNFESTLMRDSYSPGTTP